MENVDGYHLNFEELKFKKINGFVIPNIGQYILDYLKLKKSNSIKISIGCDSNNKRFSTIYILTVSFYDMELNNGVHYVFARHNQKKMKNNWNRLYVEALYLKQLGNYLENILKGKYYIEHDDIDKEVKSFYENTKPTKLVEVHLDLNPEPSTRLRLSNKKRKLDKKNLKLFSDNKSNSVYSSGVSLLAGDGFKVVAKPKAFTSSSAADRHTKQKK